MAALGASRGLAGGATGAGLGESRGDSAEPARHTERRCLASSRKTLKGVNALLAEHADPWLIPSPSIRTRAVGIIYSPKFDKLNGKAQSHFLQTCHGLEVDFSCG